MKTKKAETSAEVVSGSGRGSNKGCLIVAGIGCGSVLILIGLFLVLLVAAVVSGPSFSTTYYEDVIQEGSDDKIAVISVDGLITQGTGNMDFLTTSLATTESINQRLDQALQDEYVQAVILKMNTPGGDAVASDLIYRKVVEVQNQKPVVTWISGMGASGGYYIAVGSEKIIAHPGAITGSIGTILEVTNLDGLYEKLGIDVKVFKSGKFKDDEGLFDEDPNGEADQILQGLVDEAYDDFVGIVAAEREMTVDQVKELADGRMYSGKQAYEKGLIDELGDMNDAIALVEESTGRHGMTVVSYSSGSFWDSFYGYRSSLLSKLGIVTSGPDVGIKVYYLLDI